MAFSEHQQLQPEDLLRFITQQQEQIIQLKEQIELLEAEIRRLKKLPVKPDIKPNTKPPDDDTDSSDGGPSTPEGDDGASPENSSKHKVKKPNEKTRKQRKQPRKPSVEKSIPIAATDVPQGSIRNGTTPFHVQELTIQTCSIEYLFWAMGDTRWTYHYSHKPRSGLDSWSDRLTLPLRTAPDSAQHLLSLHPKQTLSHQHPLIPL